MKGAELSKLQRFRDDVKIAMMDVWSDVMGENNTEISIAGRDKRHLLCIEITLNQEHYAAVFGNIITQNDSITDESGHGALVDQISPQWNNVAGLTYEETQPES